MSHIAPTTTLLDLPNELLSEIIFDVLTSVNKAPVFEEIIDDRVPMVGSFDEMTTENIKIYLPRYTPHLFQGDGLLATNRRLRALTQKVRKSMSDGDPPGIEFVLDVMFVKGLGHLPTWLCAPFIPRKKDTLRIQFRIVRPPVERIPPDWINRAQCADAADSHDQVDKNLAAVMLPYALGRLRLKSSPVDEGTGSSQITYYEAMEDDTDLYEVDELLIDVHTLPVVSESNKVDMWCQDDVIPDGYRKPPHVPFGWGSYLESLGTELSVAQRGGRFAYRGRPTLACYELGERLKKLITDLAEEGCHFRDSRLPAQTLVANVNVISIRTVDSPYTELKYVTETIKKFRARVGICDRGHQKVQRKNAPMTSKEQEQSPKTIQKEREEINR